MTGTAPLGAPAADPADGRTSDERTAAAARVFDRLTRTIIDAHTGRDARRGGKTLVLNDAAGDVGMHGGSTTTVHMADNGRVLKVVALGRQGGTPGKTPPVVNFAEGSVRATVAKVRIAGHTDTAAHSVGR